MALLTPYLQKQFIFLHNIKFPFFPKFDNPEKYGLAPFKVRNFKLTTSDNVKIGESYCMCSSETVKLTPRLYCRNVNRSLAYSSVSLFANKILTSEVMSHILALLIARSFIRKR